MILKTYVDRTNINKKSPAYLVLMISYFLSYIAMRAGALTYMVFCQAIHPKFSVIEVSFTTPMYSVAVPALLRIVYLLWKRVPDLISIDTNKSSTWYKVMDLLNEYTNEPGYKKETVKYTCIGATLLLPIFIKLYTRNSW